MKKKVSLLLFFLSVLLFATLYAYTETDLINSGGYFNYHVSDFIGYLFSWSLIIFIVSLLASKLDRTKYRMWLLLSVIYTGMSVLNSWHIGDGGGSILSFNGEMFTWFSAGLYFIISVVYFINQHIKNKKQSNLL